MRVPFIDDDVPKTRNHYYPNWLLFTGSLVPKLVKQNEVGQDICDHAIQIGAAIAIPKRHDSIAAALTSRLWVEWMWSYYISFLFMLETPSHYKRGWLDFLDVVSMKVVDSVCEGRGLTAYWIRHELREEVAACIQEYYRETSYHSIEVSCDVHGAQFVGAVREFKIRAEYETKMLVFQRFE